MSKDDTSETPTSAEASASVSGGSIHLPTDYTTRAKEVDKRYRSLTVKYVDSHDIWFTKLGAFRSKDRVDMIQMIKEGVVDTSMLDAMFGQWNLHWFNDSPELVKNYSEVRFDDSEN
ncbi:DUF6036 family nucleotidyltransferase [Paenibacillus alkaliterrae]|uniref:DUF6036 family nucleotidyltransferase n=1 Tax=Paenibacillus alkaliterrae TaxID=320909 RepID=UPI0038B2D178